MRAEIAGYFKNGHPFSDDYTSLSEMQTYILYRYVTDQKKESKLSVLKLIRDVMDVTFKQFNNFFETTWLFINPKAFEKVQEWKKTQEKIKTDKENGVTQIDEDNFSEEWEKMLQIIPEQIVVEESSHAHDLLVKERKDPELDAKIQQWQNTGWLRRQKRRDDLDGNE